MEDTDSMLSTLSEGAACARKTQDPILKNSYELAVGLLTEVLTTVNHAAKISAQQERWDDHQLKEALVVMSPETLRHVSGAVTIMATRLPGGSKIDPDD